VGMASMLFAPGYDASFWVDRWQTNPAARFGPAFDNLSERDDVRPRLGESRRPALGIHGELDATMPVARGEDLCARIPGCEGVFVVPGAGHTANLENRDAFNETLPPFAGKHSSGVRP